MTRLFLLMFVYCFLIKTYGQTNNVLFDETAKVLIYSSIQSDGNNTAKETFQEWISYRQNDFLELQIKESSVYSFYRPLMLDSISGQYSMQIYEVPSNNLEKQSRYILKYKDFCGELWLRLGGYVENDVNLLFDYLKKIGLKNRHIKQMLKEWTIQEGVFSNIDWVCLFEGYLKNDLTRECFISIFYIEANANSINFNPVSEKKLYSIFARMPLYGYFRNCY